MLTDRHDGAPDLIPYAKRESIAQLSQAPTALTNWLRLAARGNVQKYTSIVLQEAPPAPTGWRGQKTIDVKFI